MEGLLLLSKLRAPDEVAAREQLAKILDVAQKPLVTDLRGTATRRGRRHPLKKIFFDVKGPQTIEALAAAVKVVVDKTWDLYPDVSRFLRSTFLPLVCGHPWTWPDGQEPLGFLGTDADPVVGERTPPPQIPFEIPQVTKHRPFTADDLVGELAEVLKPGDHSTTILAISPYWRGEASWDFLEAIHRLSHRLRWLAPRLAEHVDLQALRAAGQAWHGKDKRFATGRAHKWRERHYVEPSRRPSPDALLAPSDRDQSWGILHLRGLLLFGRMNRSQGDLVDSDAALVQLIDALKEGVVVESRHDNVITVSRDPLPLELVLDKIGNPEDLLTMAEVLESLMPEIHLADENAARLLREQYLPLLKGELPAIKAPPPPPGNGGTGASKHKTTRRSSKRRTSTVRRTRLRVQTREKPLQGEPPEEAEPGQWFYRRTEPGKKAPSVKEEIRWVQLRIWGSNPLLIRNHIESLSGPETQRVAEQISTRVAADISAGQTAKARTGIIVALILITGQDPETLAVADERLSDGVAEIRPRINLREGKLRLPVLRPENAFNAESSPGKKLLEPTVALISFQLPPTIAQWINALLAIDDSVWQWEQGELRDAATLYVADVEMAVGTGISLSRLRNSAQANMRESSGDLVKTMITSCSTLGRPETSLFYYNGSSADLEKSFRKATWPLFGDRPTKVVRPADKGERVGSQLLVTPAAAARLARAPSSSMNSPSKGGAWGTAVQDHNALTTHILCMLVGAGGHRPTAALLCLTRFDFDTDQPAAIFQDKKSDPAHFYRYAPVADLIAEQVDGYIRHLRALAQTPGASAAVARRVASALRGDAPLFFGLDSSAVPVELDLDSWRQTLPDIWQLLPLNWGRTWIASRGREAGIDSDHLAIALGHLESVGYPFSSESPMEPAQLSGHMARPLGKLARDSGWVSRKGLAGKADSK
ncbi:MAG: hypothetical protein KDI75_03740, partial [Xanthomonadales bacterium]|nr:hypothetical protein [Xanthomonadales bacterium]